MSLRGRRAGKCHLPLQDLPENQIPRILPLRRLYGQAQLLLLDNLTEGFVRKDINHEQIKSPLLGSRQKYQFSSPKEWWVWLQFRDGRKESCKTCQGWFLLLFCPFIGRVFIRVKEDSYGMICITLNARLSFYLLFFSLSANKFRGN